MAVTSVTGRRRDLVKPLRDGSAIGDLDRFSAPFFHSEIAYVVENVQEKKRKLLRFMREAVRRRLSVKRPNFRKPPPGEAFSYPPRAFPGPTGATVNGIKQPAVSPTSFRDVYEGKAV